MDALTIKISEKDTVTFIQREDKNVTLFVNRGNPAVIERSNFEEFINSANIALKNQVNICYKTKEPCKYNCSGICKESV